MLSLKILAYAGSMNLICNLCYCDLSIWKPENNLNLQNLPCDYFRWQDHSEGTGDWRTATCTVLFDDIGKQRQTQVW